MLMVLPGGGGCGPTSTYFPFWSYDINDPYYWWGCS